MPNTDSSSSITWKPSAKGSERKSAAGPKWRRDLPKPVVHRGRRMRAIKLFTAFSLFALFCLLFVYVSAWVWPLRSAHLYLVGAKYARNLQIAPNVFGWRSIIDLADLAEEKASISPWEPGLVKLGGPKTLLKTSDWSKELSSVTEPTLVVFMSAHGGADTEGAYLLPEDADPGPDKANRLRLTDVLSQLSSLPAAKNKLLVLDATQVTANWQFGMLQNDFVRELKALAPTIEQIPNLLVLCASDVDQRSWVCEEWKETVFAHYFTEGLEGAGDTNTDGRVDAQELFQYVQRWVTAWAWTNRVSLQTPIMLPDTDAAAKYARSVELTVVRQRYRHPPVTELPAYEAPDRLLQAWTKLQKLSQQQPSPAVYSPYTWRRYRDMLLRYDYLLRSGVEQAAEDAVGLADELSLLELDIQRAPLLQLGSVQNSLAMPALAGLSTPISEQLTSQWNKLWNAQPKDYETIWTQIQGTSSGADLELARLAVYQLMLQRVRENPTANLSRAYDLLQIIEDPIYPQPTEIHFLTMLHRDLPAKTVLADFADPLQAAIDVSRLGEQAAMAIPRTGYAYSESVNPSVRMLVQQGDAKRRLGQDLVFAAESQDWRQSNSLLQEATALYTRSQSRADVVRRALSVRDTVLPMLPYYSKWLGLQRTPEDSQRQRDNATLLNLTESLWSQTYELVDGIEKALHPGATDVNDAQLRSLAEQADAVAQAFQNIERQYAQFWRDLADVELPELWRDAEDALEVPFIDPQFRMRLLEHKRRISRRLLAAYLQSSNEAPTVTSAQNEAWAKDGARRQGRMAMAVLGKRWFDSNTGPDLESYEQVQHRLVNFSVEAEWWKSIDAAGAQIGQRWVQMPLTIDQLCKTFATQTLQEGRGTLQEADELTRQLNGGATLTQNAVDMYRKWLAQDLLLWQCQRTLDDHWFSEDPKAEPYYRVAGLVYANNATGLVSGPQAAQAVQALVEKLNQPGELVVNGPSSEQITSEQRFSVEYNLAPAKGATVPPGYPVVWVGTGPNLNLLYPTADARLVRQIGAGAPEALVTCTVVSPLVEQAETNPPPAPTSQRSTFTLSGRFRGQELSRTTSIDLSPVPQTVVRQHVPPRLASVAVQADESLKTSAVGANASLVIVLDCSGSMRSVDGMFNASTKYVQATNALQQVLLTTPQGTTVSVWVFGQARQEPGQSKTVEQAERTILQIQPPVNWDPTDPNQLTNLMAKVAYPALEPWNESPIVRAMMTAKDDFRQATGFKTMLVITDGMDDRFEKDTAANPNKTPVPTALVEAFGSTDIEVNVVGFKIEDSEEQKAQQQFSVIESFPIPGKWYSVDDENTLATALAAAMKAKARYYVETPDSVVVPGVPPGGLEASPPGSNFQWFPGGLSPGGYQLVLRGNNPVQKNILLNRGDLLLTKLVTNNQQTQFRRALFSLENYDWKPSKQTSSWRFAVLQNQLFTSKAMQMLVTLESLPINDSTTLQQVKPRFTWIELTPTGVQTPYTFQWNVESGYPAPAWSLNVPQWPAMANTPAPAVPNLKIWWNPDQDPPPAATLLQGHDYKTYRDIVRRQLPVGDEVVTIESVKVESHSVETKPGVRELKSCMVVRISHVPGKPVWVRANGVSPAGHEHRFYSSVGRYTALFWPLIEDEANGLSSLNVYSLAAFKKHAEAREFAMEISNLPPPLSSDVRPQKPVSLD